MCAEPVPLRAVTGSMGEDGRQQRTARAHPSGSSRRKRHVPKGTLTRFHAEDNRLAHEVDHSHREAYSTCSSAQCTSKCMDQYPSCDAWMRSHNKGDDAAHDAHGLHQHFQDELKPLVPGPEIGAKNTNNTSNSSPPPVKTRLVSSTRSVRRQVQSAMAVEDAGQSDKTDETQTSRSFPYDIRKNLSPLLPSRDPNASADTSPVGTFTWMPKAFGLLRPSDTQKWPGATDKGSLAQVRTNLKSATNYVSAHVRKATGR